MTRLLLVDGFNLIRRVYEARKDTSELEEIVAACGQSLRRATREHDPTHAAVILDSHERTWRHLLYPDYKAGRKPTPGLLLDHLSAFESEFSRLGVAGVTVPSYEADDVIATLADGVARSGAEVMILSTDRWFLQLLRDGIRIFNHFDHKETTVADVEDRLGVDVARLVDYWAMTGDSGNNIKGAPGIGPKTARSLLRQYDGLSAIIDAEKKIGAHRDTVMRCKRLVTLKTDVEVGVNLRDLRLEPTGST